MDSIAVAAEFKFAGAQDDAGLVEGYGSVFGVRDSRGDVMAPGSFATTLASMRARGFNVPMYLNHGAAMGGDNLPAGVWDEIEEDGTGLRVKGRLLGLNTDTGRYRYELAKGGALRGLSIGFITRKADYGKAPSQPRRTIKAVDLIEVSLVDDPANPAARVTSLKSSRGFDARALEAALRRDEQLKLSSAAAVRVVALTKKHLREGGDEPDNGARDAATAAQVAALVRRNVNILTKD